MTEFSSKNTQEKVYLGFDFSNRLDTAETISTATFYIRAVQGIDLDSSTMLSGSSVISGGTVRIKVQNGIAGFTYELSVVVTTSGGRTLFAKAPVVVN
jgi:hypothetical protein